MVNPVLTALFDFFLIGSGGVIVAGMIEEYHSSRQPAAGRTRRVACRSAARRAVPVRQRRFQLSVG